MKTSSIKMLVNGINRYLKEYGVYPTCAFMDDGTREDLLKRIAELPKEDKVTRRTIKRTRLIQRENIQHHIKFGMSERDF